MKVKIKIKINRKSETLNVMTCNLRWTWAENPGVSLWDVFTNIFWVGGP